MARLKSLLITRFAASTLTYATSTHPQSPTCAGQATTHKKLSKQSMSSYSASDDTLNHTSRNVYAQPNEIHNPCPVTHDSNNDAARQPRFQNQHRVTATVLAAANTTRIAATEADRVLVLAATQNTILECQIHAFKHCYTFISQCTTSGPRVNYVVKQKGLRDVSMQQLKHARPRTATHANNVSRCRHTYIDNDQGKAEPTCRIASTKYCSHKKYPHQLVAHETCSNQARCNLCTSTVIVTLPPLTKFIHIAKSGSQTHSLCITA